MAITLIYIFVSLIAVVLSTHLGAAVVHEERYAGGFYEPIRIVGVKKVLGKRILVYNSPSDGYSTAQIRSIGSAEFIFQELYPHVKVRIRNTVLPFLPSYYVGFIPILFQRLIMTIFFPSLFSLRLTNGIFLFVSLFTIYLIARRLIRSKWLSFVGSLYFLVHNPIFTPSIHYAFSFAFFLLMINEILKDSPSLLKLSFFSALLLHSHFLMGGAIIIALGIACLIVYHPSLKIIFKKLHYLLPILIFSIPFFLVIFIRPLYSRTLMYPHTFKLSLHLKFILKTFENILSIIFLHPAEFHTLSFLPLSAILLSILSGLLLVSGSMYTLMKHFSSKLKLLLYFIVIYIPFGFTRITKPLHFYPVVVCLFIFLLNALRYIRLLNTLLFGMVLAKLMIVPLLLPVFVKSPFSIVVQKRVAEYLTRMNVRKIYVLNGGYGFEIFTRNAIKTVEIACPNFEEIKKVLEAEERPLYLYVSHTPIPSLKTVFYIGGYKNQNIFIGITPGRNSGVH